MRRLPSANASLKATCEPNRRTGRRQGRLRNSIRLSVGTSPRVARRISLHNLLSRFIPMDLLPFSSAKSGDALARGDHEFESLLLQRGVWYEPDFRKRIPSMTVGDFANANPSAALARGTEAMIGCPAEGSLRRNSDADADREAPFAPGDQLARIARHRVVCSEERSHDRVTVSSRLVCELRPAMLAPCVAALVFR
jgi:hypothetical protein